MTLVSGLAIYFIIWWLTLFVVLPIGIRSQAENDAVVPGTDPGAPVRTHLAARLMANTVLAGIVFGALYVMTRVFGFGMEDLASMIVPQ
jgi:predicted secreted protein